MTDLKRRINEARTFVRSKTSIKPDVAIILGTGLGGLAKEIKRAVRIPYSRFPISPSRPSSDIQVSSSWASSPARR